METLSLKQRPPVEDEIENWDDDDFHIDSDDHLAGFAAPRSMSVATNHRPARRDSYSSHMSFRSDRDSLHGEEERQVHIPGDDEKSTLDAIATAASAGIPIPKNVPSSALMGGTIKRLGARRVKRIVQEDWEHDIEMPEPGQGLRIKPQDQEKFPEAIRQVSGSFGGPPSPASPPPKALRSAAHIIPHSLRSSPVKQGDGGGGSAFRSSTTSAVAVPINLNRFVDDDDDDDFLGDGCDTIRVSKTRRAATTPMVTPAMPHDHDDSDHHGPAECADDDDFENDFDLPDSGNLNLAARNDGPKTPTSQHDDFDWGEGSLGVRYAGTRRAANGGGVRSSSASAAMSPSVSSTVTYGSEDEAFDDLELPTGPLDFKERLSRRRASIESGRDSPVESSKPSTPTGQSRQQQQQQQQQQSSSDKGPAATTADLFDGLDLGDGEIFDSNKLTNHRNLKLKETSPTTQQPKTAVSLTFTTKPITQTNSRLPRPSHERTQSLLEPVFESGGSTLQRKRRSIGTGRTLGHASQGSISSIPTPSTLGGAPSAMASAVAASQRRQTGAKGPPGSLRGSEPTTTNSQLLRIKRSLPAMKPPPPASPTKMMSNGVLVSMSASGSATSPGSTAGAASSSSSTPPSSGSPTGGRPPSRGDRTQSFGRPRTPGGAAVDSLARKPAPFYTSSGAAAGGAHSTGTKPRPLRRQPSEHSIDMRPRSRTVSRSTMRSPSPRRKPSAATAAAANDDFWSRLAQPKKPKNFGDGHELDAFDDLPTSIQAESRFMKTAAAKPQSRIKGMQRIPPTTTAAAAPAAAPATAPSPGPYQSMLSSSSPRADKMLPRFARDTAASRIARETALTTIAQRVPNNGPLGPLPFRSGGAGGPFARSGSGHHSHGSQSTLRARRRANEPPKKPSLISNLNMSKGPKTVNGMSYNPVTFSWEGNENALSAFDVPGAGSPLATPATPLVREKEQPSTTPRPALITNRTSIGKIQMVGHMMFDPQAMCWIKIGPSPATRSEAAMTTADDDEDDVFKDIPDLEDKPTESECGGPTRGSGDIKDEWLVGEEFDVGPEFVRRQREEEERWRKKCAKWVGRGTRDRDAWRWTIRELVNLYGPMPLN
jgi:hypothetical protein